MFDRNHPTNAEPILEHAEFWRPERFLERRDNQAVLCQRSKDTLGLGFISYSDRKRETVEVLVAFALAIRRHQCCLADSDGGMHHLLVEAIRQPLRLRAFLKTLEHQDLRADRTAIKLECFFTTTAEEKIRLNH